MGRGDRLRDGAQGFNREDVRQGSIEPAEAASAPPGPGEIGHADFAVAFLERIGLELRHVDRRDQAASGDGRSCPVRRLCQVAVPQSVHTRRDPG